MRTREHHDAVIIAAGYGRGPFASALTQAGRGKALIEREHIGWSSIPAVQIAMKVKLP